MHAGLGKLISCFLRDESASAAIEYALIAAGIALGVQPAIDGAAISIQATMNTLARAIHP